MFFLELDFFLEGWMLLLELEIFYQSNYKFLSSINLAILVIKNLDLDKDPDPDRNSTNVDPGNLLRR